MKLYKKVLSLFSLLILSLIVIDIFQYYNFDTGFYSRYVKLKEGYHYIPYKTLWDWMQLLIIPIALVLGGYFLNRSEKRREVKAAEKRAKIDREIAKQQREEDKSIAFEQRMLELEIAKVRNEEKVLSKFLDEMSGLILEKNLISSAEGDLIRQFARIRTISALHQLSENRVNIVFNFLRDTNLIRSIYNRVEDEKIDLNGVKFRNVDFSLSYLELVKFNESNFINSKFLETNFVNAYCENAYFDYCDFEKAILNNAKFQRVKITGSNLKKSSLWSIDLTYAQISNSSFENPEFIGAKLNSARFKELNLANAKLHGAKVNKTNFISCDLDKSEFNGAELEGAVFEDCNLTGADFSNSKGLQEDQFSKSYYIDIPPKLPKGIKYPPEKYYH